MLFFFSKGELLAAYPVFFIAAESPGQVQWVDVAVVTSAVVCAGLVMWVLLRVTGRSAGSAAVAAGCDGLFVETQFEPARAKSDARVGMRSPSNAL